MRKILFVILLLLMALIPGVAAAEIPPEPEPLLTLQLTSMCSANPSETRAWRVRNPNAVDVEFTWELYGTTMNGTDTVPANSDYIFETPTQDGANTLVLFVDGVQQAVKASGGQQCPPTWDKSSIKVSAVCDAGVPTFTITNSGDGNMQGPSEWYLLYGSGGASDCAEDVASGFLVQGTFQLTSGASEVIAFSGEEYKGVPLHMCVKQRDGHPGTGWAAAAPEPNATCNKPTAIDEDKEPEVRVFRIYAPVIIN